MQMTLLEGCPVAELPRFMPEEWRNILDWYDATVCTDTLRRLHTCPLIPKLHGEKVLHGIGACMMLSTTEEVCNNGMGSCSSISSR